MSNEPKCPKCGCDYAYEEGSLWVCPECSFEWKPKVTKDPEGHFLTSSAADSADKSDRRVT